MKKGYLIPENAQPTTNRCLRVFVPDDPLYIAAFLGALTYFGQWTAWERDKEKRGQFAASAWKDANELTIDGLSLACGDYPLTEDEMSDILDKLDEISERLKELEDMDVIVNQTVNSGCGCGCDGETSSTTNTVTTPIIDPTDTGISPPYDDTVYTVVDAVKCRAANWLVDKTIGVIRGWANIGAVEVTVVAVAGAFFTIFAVLGGVATGGIVAGVVVFTIAGLVIQLAQYDDFQVDDLDILAAEIESMREEFVCVMYGWTTASELSAALLGFLYSRVDETATSVGWTEETKDKVKVVFEKIFGSEFSNYIVQNVGAIVPADFVAQYSCLCGATGDSCPNANLHLSAYGELPAGDLTGTTEGFASTFNSTTGYYEIIFELAENYCVTIENGVYTPEESHEKCSGGVMVPSDGSCIRRFVARSQTPFGTAVTFDSQSEDCSCEPSDLLVWRLGTDDGHDCPTDSHPFATCGNTSYCSPLGGYTILFRTIDIDAGEYVANGMWVETSGSAGNHIILSINNGDSKFANDSTDWWADVGGRHSIDFENPTTFGDKSGAIPDAFDLRISFGNAAGGDNTCVIAWGIY